MPTQFFLRELANGVNRLLSQFIRPDDTAFAHIPSRKFELGLDQQKDPAVGFDKFESRGQDLPERNAWSEDVLGLCRELSLRLPDRFGYHFHVENDR